MPQGLNVQAQAVPLRQLLHRERRPKIAIVRAYQAQNGLPEGLTAPVIARTAAFARHHSGWTFGGTRTTQPINLAASQTPTRKPLSECCATLRAESSEPA
jgi:hypothetical protein